MIYNRQSKALSISLVKSKLTPYTRKNKQTNKQTKTKNAYLETSEFNTKEDFFYIPLSTGDREKNEVIMTNRINHKNANNL